MATKFVRGSGIGFSVVFKDPDGNIVTPSSAFVKLSFPGSGGSRSSVELALTNVSGTWKASWDSGSARPGQVYWSAQTRSTSPAAAVDGSFELTANVANPENDN